MQRLLKQLEKQDLLILDELGYVPCGKAGSELLFNENSPPELNIDSRDRLGYIPHRWHIVAPPDGTLSLRRLHRYCSIVAKASLFFKGLS